MIAGSPMDGFSEAAGTDQRLSDQPAVTIDSVTFVLLDGQQLQGN
jgi:hypothetical protein